MKYKRDVIVSGATESAAALRKRLDSSEWDKWKRASKIEERMEDPNVRVFHYGGTPPAHLFLFLENERASVSNILAESELSPDEYNRIAENFVELVLNPAIEGLELKLHLGPVSATFEDDCSERVLKAMREFSSLANKWTLNNHPYDARRWRKFVILAHVDEASNDEELIAEWFLRNGWPAADAGALTSMYLQGRELLHDYDERR